MNERIKELLKQAGAEVRAEWDKGNKIPYPEAHHAFQRDNDQKFAELIIEDCICVVDGAVHHRLPASSYVDLIREHFAVE
jgi:hypothetical protein